MTEIAIDPVVSVTNPSKNGDGTHTDALILWNGSTTKTDGYLTS